MTPGARRRKKAWRKRSRQRRAAEVEDLRRAALRVLVAGPRAKALIARHVGPGWVVMFDRRSPRKKWKTAEAAAAHCEQEGWDPQILRHVRIV